MRRMHKYFKNFITAFILCLWVVGLCGCEKELTESDIKATDVYQDLETEYNKLQRKYDKLSGNQADTSTEETQVNASQYLSKVKQSNYTKVRYSCNRNSRYEITDNASLCKWLKNQLAKAIPDTNKNAEEFQTEQTALYSYTLYNENNSICQCQIYEGNYVIFSDIADTVYYAAGTCRLGDASFAGENFPNIPRSFKLQFYESQLAYKGGELLSIAETKLLAGKFADMQLKKLAVKPADVEAVAQEEYIFKCDGTTYVVEAYTSCFSVTKDGSQVEWYQAEPDEVREFLELPE